MQRGTHPERGRTQLEVGSPLRLESRLDDLHQQVLDEKGGHQSGHAHHHRREGHGTFVGPDGQRPEEQDDEGHAVDDDRGRLVAELGHGRGLLVATVLGRHRKVRQALGMVLPEGPIVGEVCPVHDGSVRSAHDLSHHAQEEGPGRDVHAPLHPPSWICGPLWVQGHGPQPRADHQNGEHRSQVEARRGARELPLEGGDGEVFACRPPHHRASEAE
mmetsp:Transcript_65076/g.136326  ORF Transcript_65076/g.136326 Transcript_65076/m.136326 type:complete len:216 (-) Transcript_65076:379-1026(-)